MTLGQFLNPTEHSDYCVYHLQDDILLTNESGPTQYTVPLTHVGPFHNLCVFVPIIYKFDNIQIQLNNDSH